MKPDIRSYLKYFSHFSKTNREKKLIPIPNYNQSY